MPAVLDWSPAVDPSDLVARVREALAAGALVVLPGDSGYVVLLDPASPHRKSFPENALHDLAYGPDDPAVFGLTAPLVARRLMFRAWPAPLVIGIGDRRFRFPDHLVMEAVYPAVHENGRLRPTLIADTFLNTAADALAKYGDAVSLAVDAGAQNVNRPTVVHCDESGWRIEQEGDFAADEIQRLAARIVLFICTGNTCRSPLAEGLARKMLADRLGCAQEELASRGYWMLSAGVAAFGGSPASPESADVAAEFGADLFAHRSRPVNPQLLAAADDIIAMTRGHAYSLASNYPDLGPPPRLLCGDDDLDDPIGASLEVYRECANAIRNHLERHIREWTGS
jgi:protein-tyrosine-phosphatase/tRNA A37 threonylcarbamoyladenosine synthetase subunit TsaC/SUA5/YrdC